MTPPAFLSALPASRTAWRQTRPPCVQKRRPSFSQPAAQTRCRPQVRRAAPKCFDDSLGPDGDPDEETFFLHDAHGRSLSCGVEQSMTHAGEEYLLCYPIHDPVAFARVDGVSGSLQAVEDAEEIDRIFENASAVLAEEDLKLVRSAYVLTVDDEACFEEEEEEKEGEEEEEEMDVGDDEQAVEVMAQFLNEGREYLVVKPTEPVLLVARKAEEDFVVLQGPELEKIIPVVEEFIEKLEV